MNVRRGKCPTENNKLLTQNSKFRFGVDCALDLLARFLHIAGMMATHV